MGGYADIIRNNEANLGENIKIFQPILDLQETGPVNAKKKLAEIRPHVEAQTGVKRNFTAKRQIEAECQAASTQRVFHQLWNRATGQNEKIDETCKYLQSLIKESFKFYIFERALKESYLPFNTCDQLLKMNRQEIDAYFEKINSNIQASMNYNDVSKDQDKDPILRQSADALIVLADLEQRRRGTSEGNLIKNILNRLEFSKDYFRDNTNLYSHFPLQQILDLDETDSESFRKQLSDIKGKLAGIETKIGNETSIYFLSSASINYVETLEKKYRGTSEEGIIRDILDTVASIINIKPRKRFLEENNSALPFQQICDLDDSDPENFKKQLSDIKEKFDKVKPDIKLKRKEEPFSSYTPDYRSY